MAVEAADVEEAALGVDGMKMPSATGTMTPSAM
jgi:hypothetical protein